MKMSFLATSIVSIFIGGNICDYTVIDPPSINSGTVIDHPVIIPIVMYAREVVTSTRAYMNPYPELINLICIILILY